MRCQVWTFVPKTPEVKRMVARDARTLKAALKDMREWSGKLGVAFFTEKT